MSYEEEPCAGLHADDGGKDKKQDKVETQCLTLVFGGTLTGVSRAQEGLPYNLASHNTVPSQLSALFAFYIKLSQDFISWPCILSPRNQALVRGARILLQDPLLIFIDCIPS